MTGSVGGSLQELQAARPELYALMEEVARRLLDKGADYGGEEDPYRNLRRCENQRVAPWKGVALRMGDKQSRLETIAGAGEMRVDELPDETFLDTAGYALCGAHLYRDERRCAEAAEYARWIEMAGTGDATTYRNQEAELNAAWADAKLRHRDACDHEANMRYRLDDAFPGIVSRGRALTRCAAMDPLYRQWQEALKTKQATYEETLDTYNVWIQTQTGQECPL